MMKSVTMAVLGAAIAVSWTVFAFSDGWESLSVLIALTVIGLGLMVLVETGPSEETFTAGVVGMTMIVFGWGFMIGAATESTALQWDAAPQIEERAND